MNELAANLAETSSKRHPIHAILKAAHFAAEKHAGQRRKGARRRTVHQSFAGSSRTGFWCVRPNPTRTS